MDPIFRNDISSWLLRGNSLYAILCLGNTSMLASNVHQAYLEPPRIIMRMADEMNI